MDVIKRIFLAPLFLAPFFLSSCATAPACSGAQACPTPDPYHTYNQGMFKFNQNADKMIFKPAAEAYTMVVPKPVRQGIHNVFSNVGMISTIINDVLQVNVRYAISDSWRFLFNSTLGIGGLFDVSQHLGLPPHTTDFGITLAHWGYTQSNYLVLPLFGPSTVRDALALPVDNYSSIYPYIHPFAWQVGLYAGKTLDTRSELLETQKNAHAMVFNPYIFYRDVYLGQRQNKIKRAAEGLPMVEKSSE